MSEGIEPPARIPMPPDDILVDAAELDVMAKLADPERDSDQD